MSEQETSQPQNKRFRRAVIPAQGPIRTLAKMTLINTLGNGLYITIEAIFFTRSVNLTNHQVALGLGTAAGIALLVNIPSGHLADKWKPRELQAIFLVLQGVAMASFALVHSFAGFVTVAIMSALFRNAGGAAGMALISRLGVGEERVRIRAYQRSISNLGLSLGMGIAAVALAVDTREAYVAMVVGNAITFVGAAFFVLQLPKISPTKTVGIAKTTRRLVALRDRHFLIATALNGCMSIQFAIQSVGVPLWIVQYTHAPRWWVGVVMIINTTSVILLQVRFTRGTQDLTFAARAFRRSGLLIGAACLLYALTQGLNGTVASVVLLVATVIDVLGELLSSSASWAIGFGMAAEELQGQYQGVYSMSIGVANIFGPLLVTSTALAIGGTGWILLAGMFVLTGAAYPPLVRSYLRQKERTTRSM